MAAHGQVVGAGVIVFLLAFVARLPLLLIAELTDPIWLVGLGNALFDVGCQPPTSRAGVRHLPAGAGGVDAPSAHD